MNDWVFVTEKHAKSFLRLDEIEKLASMLPLERSVAFGDLSAELPRTYYFVGYSLKGESIHEDAKLPRLSKPGLRVLRGSMESDVDIHILGFDYDNPRHEPWDKKTFRDFQLAIGELELLDDCGCFYTTEHGARFVYFLDKPVSPEVAEQLTSIIRARFSEQGISLDQACKDWTRLFKLPRFPGQSERFLHHFFLADYDPGRVLKVSTFGGLEEGTKSPTVYGDTGIEIHESEEHPSANVVREILTSPGASAWRKAMKKHLKGWDCYASLYENKPLAEIGKRRNTLHRYIGQVIGIAVLNFPKVQEEEVYALFWELLEMQVPDASGPTWHQDAWQAIRDYFFGEREQQKIKGVTEKQRRIEEARDSTDPLAQTASGLRSWCSDDLIISEDPEDWLVCIRKHGILSVGSSSGYFVLQPDGFYSPDQVSRSHLASKIKQLGMASLLPIITARGKVMVTMTGQDILDEYLYIVNSIEGSVGRKGSIIAGYGTQSEKLSLSLFHRRTDLQPTYCKDADTWLKKLGGVEYQSLCDWIGLALAIEEGPICALSISGPPGIGKKLLTQGLAECINTEVIADTGSFGRFNSLLMQTPFLVINEGIPKDMGAGARDPADAFRHMTSGDALVVEKKYKEPVTIRNPLRVIFAANNLEVIQTLTKDRDLSPDDRDALGVRIYHIDSSAQAADWLRGQGGLQFTGAKGLRWIGSDCGDPSDYILAKHFLWLYENRPDVPPGNRLLMEGTCNQDAIKRMTTRSGAAPDVIRTIVAMIEVEQTPAGIHVDPVTGRILVTSHGIAHFYSRDMYNRKILSTQHIANVLRALGVRGQADGAKQIIRVGQRTHRARWWELDATVLLYEAHEYGYDCARLEVLEETQRAHAHGEI